MGLRVFGVQIEDKERGLARKYKECLCEGMAIAFTGKASKWIFEWLLFPTSSQRTKWDIETRGWIHFVSLLIRCVIIPALLTKNN